MSALAVLGGTYVGFSIDFTDMTAIVRDPKTPINNFEGDPNDLLTYDNPSPKSILLPTGELELDTTLRTDYDVAGVALGLLVEGEATNLARDSQASGAVLGVISDGGAAPTGWGVQGSDLGLATEVLAADIDPVIKGIRIQISGTATSTGTYRFRINRGPFLTGTYAMTAFLRAVAGSTDNMSGIRLSSVNAGDESHDPPLDLFAPDTLARARNTTGSFPNVVATEFEKWVEFRFGASIGAAIDITLEIGGAQIEIAETFSSYIPTPVNTTVTRNEDVILLPIDKFPWNDGYGILEIDGVKTQPVIQDGALRIVPWDTHVKTVKWRYDPNIRPHDVAMSGGRRFTYRGVPDVSVQNVNGGPTRGGKFVGDMCEGYDKSPKATNTTAKVGNNPKPVSPNSNKMAQK